MDNIKTLIEIRRKFRQETKQKVGDINGNTYTIEYTQWLQNELVKNLSLCAVGSSLPKVCKGCGSLSTKVIDKKYLACCPDSNYIPMEEYCKNSIYPDKQF